MTSIPRPSLDEAARTWLQQAPEGTGRVASLRSALQDFVDKRFRGAAADVRAVHTLRRSLLEDDRLIQSLLPESAQQWDSVSVAQAAADSAPPDQGRLLFCLARHLAPENVLELGTNIGISAAYIRVGLRYATNGSLTSVEASGARLELARRNIDLLGLAHPSWVEGYFDDVLPSLLPRLRPLEMAFVDGNHARDATLRYFRLLGDHMAADGVLVFDDIRWSEGMLEAWEEIRRSVTAGTVVDLGRTGIVVLE